MLKTTLSHNILVVLVYLSEVLSSSILVKIDITLLFIMIVSQYVGFFILATGYYLFGHFWAFKSKVSPLQVSVELVSSL